MKNEKVNILNINVSTGDAGSILNEAVRLIDNNQKFYICTVNAYLAVKANEDRKLLKIFNDAEIVIPDGMPLVWYSKLSEKPIKAPSLYIALVVGAILGIVSGMIGIGGGILLSPLLILLNWTTIKQTAGISAAFILLNSTSGLIGLIQKGFVLDGHTSLWIIGAFTGGVLGSYMGSRKLSVEGFKYILAGVLCLAAIKLFIF